MRRVTPGRVFGVERSAISFQFDICDALLTRRHGLGAVGPRWPMLDRMLGDLEEQPVRKDRVGLPLLCAGTKPKAFEDLCLGPADSHAIADAQRT